MLKLDMAGFRLVFQHFVGGAARLAQHRHGAQQGRSFLGGNGDVVRHVDQRRKYGLPRVGQGAVEVAHIGAVAHAGQCQRLLLQPGVGPAHGAGSHAQAFGQHAVRREFFARSQLAVDDGRSQFCRDSLVFGLASRVQRDVGNHRKRFLCLIVQPLGALILCHMIPRLCRHR